MDPIMTPGQLRLGCVDHAFPLLDERRRCQVIAALGLENVDFALWGSGPQSPLGRALTDVENAADAMRRAADEASLAISDLFVLQSATFDELAPNHPDVEVRRESRTHFETYVDLATQLGVTGLTVLPGIDWQDEEPQRSLERAAQELTHRVDVARSAGLRLSVEPHVGSVIADPGRVNDLLQQAPGLELTLDYSHFVFGGTPQEQVDPLLRAARHVHARGAAPGKLQASSRTNAIDFAAVMRALPPEYDGVVSLEYMAVDVEVFEACDVVTETLTLATVLRNAHADR
jgi:sugar phosphate isomerase/epimerase